MLLRSHLEGLRVQIINDWVNCLRVQQHLLRLVSQVVERRIRCHEILRGRVLIIAYIYKVKYVRNSPIRSHFYNLPTTAYDYVMMNWFLKFSALGAKTTAEPVCLSGDSSAAASVCFCNHKLFEI